MTGLGVSVGLAEATGDRAVWSTVGWRLRRMHELRDGETVLATLRTRLVSSRRFELTAQASG
jgi:Arc/MetJ family transcription regulator